MTLPVKSIAEAIAAGFPKLGDVRQVLIEARSALLSTADEFPDLKPIVDKQVAALDAKIAILDSVVDANDLAGLGLIVFQELAALPSTGLAPKFHPGSVTGG